MTNEEKRQQKANLLLEYQETEENLAHLREKAGRMAEPIEDVSRWLFYVHMPYPKNAADHEKRDSTIRANPEAYRRGLDLDSALSLMDEIRDAEKLLAQLRARKDALGLR